MAEKEDEKRVISRGDLRSAVTIVVVMVVVTLIVWRVRTDMIAESSARDSIVVVEQHCSIEQTPRYKLHTFDPNTADLSELLGLGLSKSEALSILRYRATGRVFNFKEEVIGCYGISDSLYFRLEPYIEIGEEFRYKKRNYESLEKEERRLLEPSKFLIDTVGVEYLVAIGALTQRQAEVFVKWRDRSGIHDLDELRACYTVSDSVARWLAQYAIFTPKRSVAEVPKEVEKVVVELNSADSAQLVGLYGVGAKSAEAIIEYREKLGGFYKIEQLQEVKIITESNYYKIIEQISLNNSDISKIDVNFATAKQLSQHPYFTPLKIRRLLKQRELKGGWRTIEEMIEDKIFTSEEAQRVRPYLDFNVQDPL